MLPAWYTDYKTFIEMALEDMLAHFFSEKGDSEILETYKDVIRYSISGGKKIRAILAIEVFLALSKQKLSDISFKSDITKWALALECIHAYSLIHDDLPAMDNDILRRGQPTVWKKYGEYNAVLAGDLLNSFSFEIISHIEDPALSQSLSKLLAHAVGYYGMIGGQIEDLYYEKYSTKCSIDILENIHHKKTGALISASIVGGAQLSKKDFNHPIVEQFGKNIGLAFQISDDILDASGTVEETGKSVGGEKKGFVHFLGLEQTKSILEELTSNTQEIAKIFASDKINFLVDYIKNRKK